MGSPDFSQSSIVIDPAAPIEGDLVTLTAIIRNHGTDPAPFAEAELQLPPAGLFVEMVGLDAASADLEARTISWTGSVAPGETRTIAVRLIVARDAGGELMLPTLHVRYLHAGSEAWIHGEAEIQTRTHDDGVHLLGIRVAPAGLVVLALVVAALAAGVALRARGPRMSGTGRSTRVWAPVMALTIAVGFWMLFASMAWRDWRTVSAFVETPCRILDGRLRSSTTTSTTGPIARRQTTNYKPLLALEYDVNGTRTISTGFDTGSRLQIGGGAAALESFERWRIGTETPCWYDPLNPADVLVIPGFGGAYFFALFPLPVFVLGLRLLRS